MLGRMEQGWFGRLLEKGANLGGSLELGKHVKDALAPVACTVAGVSIVDAWNWAASQGWGFVAILGVVVAYALLGLLALARRFLPWWSKIPQVSESASVSPEEIARVDARISQQQGSINAVWDTLNRQGAEFKEKFDGLAKSAERGRIAYQVAHAMLVLRDIRDCHRKLKKINGWLDALTGKANADTKVVYSADHISVNLYELGQDMLRFIPWKPDELRSEIATLNGERKKSRVLAVDMGTSNSDDQEKQEWKFLSDEVKCYHAFLVKARGHYIQAHRAPISEGSPEP